jgi:hypothetical protein
LDPFQLEQTAQKVLDPGETLVWCGAPDPVRTAIQTIPVAVFGIPFTGFALFWIATASGMMNSATRPASAGPWALFPLFGLPFLLIGLAMLCAPLWTFLGARQTVYGITSKRIFIGGKNGRATRSFSRSDVTSVERLDRADGSGDLYFALRAAQTVRKSGLTVTSRIGFIGIRDVAHVEATLREQLEDQAA